MQFVSFEMSEISCQIYKIKVGERSNKLHLENGDKLHWTGPGWTTPNF